MQEELDEATKKRYDTLAAKYPPKESTDPNMLCAKGTPAHDKFTKDNPI